MYSGLRGEQDASGKVNPALWQARKRGVLFDVGHGATSFAWRIAVPAIKEGWLPDVISTDLHVASMSGGMKDMPNVMSKFLALGLPFEEIVRRTTWNAARAVRQDALGHLSVGANADVAVWRIEKSVGRRRSRHSSQGFAAGCSRADVAQRQGCLRSEWAGATAWAQSKRKRKNEKRRTAKSASEPPATCHRRLA
jgi:hypothetical protein